MVLLCLLCWITCFDIRQRRIPVYTIMIGILYGCGMWIQRICAGEAQGRVFVTEVAVSALIAGICFLIRKISAESIGLGDILLLGMFSFVSGYPLMLESIFFTFSLFCLCSFFLLLCGYSKKTTLPFAPFLLAGYGITLLFHWIGSR